MTVPGIKRDYWPTREWQAAGPASLGMDPEKFTGLESMIRSRYGNLAAIVVVRKGYVVLEKYYRGFGPLDPHNVFSITKSVMSALVGIAIDSGCIQSVDQKILDFFPGYAGDVRKRTVTLRQLLTMTAPFMLKSSSAAGNEPLDRLRRQKDWVAYVLDLLGGSAQPGKFQYCTAGIHLLSAIISRTTGMCAREFANERLFKPIGMREIPDNPLQSFNMDDVFGKNVIGWVHDPQGITVGGWGLTLIPRDMARFGFLYLNRGVWDGRQVISEKWIDESVAPNANDYGYLWWLREVSGIYAFSALGSAGAVICCIPEKDLVIAIASEFVMRPRDRWELLEKYIIPAITD